MYYGRLTWVSDLSPSDIDFILSENIKKGWLNRQVPVVDILKEPKIFNGCIKNNHFKLCRPRYELGKRMFYPVVVGKFYEENNQTTIKFHVRTSLISSLFFVFMICLFLMFILAFIVLKNIHSILYALLMLFVTISFYFIFIKNCKEILAELRYLFHTKSA